MVGGPGCYICLCSNKCYRKEHLLVFSSVKDIKRTHIAGPQDRLALCGKRSYAKEGSLRRQRTVALREEMARKHILQKLKQQAGVESYGKCGYSGSPRGKVLQGRIL